MMPPLVCSVCCAPVKNPELRAQDGWRLLCDVCRAKDDVPESRFHEVRSVKQIISEQGIKPLGNFAHLALDEPDSVSAEEFNRFIRESRRGEA